MTLHDLLSPMPNLYMHGLLRASMFTGNCYASGNLAAFFLILHLFMKRLF